ncbi:kinesin-like protein KIF28P isoform X2 [Hyalella azteca]|uniref:Kinesin-like protein n=1 Tax=Hyalella azteca TaxID=294128 RepID=A0A8B7P6I1_HYAAZ|nr:kinesin-like protein KIF28P isoform X2 [Hyalella azteca]
MATENLKVAVRVRPFNTRELQRKAKCIVQMEGKKTGLTNPDDPNDVKTFTYDHSYWSFDGCRERKDGYMEKDPSHPNASKYADQMSVYADLGKGILDSAWQGYNATLFAYGQTGSGKSWSVIGYEPNKGIVPLLCEDIFKGIKEKGAAVQCEVQFSMLEIYNEVVRDLLQPKQGKGGLKIREHPKRGFYAEGLKTTMVTSYEDMNQKMQQGTINRTIASTNMNATSSRAHTIVGIKFIQKSKNATNVETAKTATINLVDLAGSERVEATGATGDRLKEGASINLSLTKLGDCIHALAEQSNGKKNVRVPFRSSTLTKLLRNALGGNSKTVMIAAISPADINFDETISTLRYADRAKQIKTTAIVNEDPVEKLIRELKEENDALKRQLQTGQINPADFVDADNDGINDKDMAKMKAKWEEEMRARMLQNDKEMIEMKKSYEEKLKAQKKDIADPSMKKKEEERLKKPHLYNLNPDPILSGKVVHILKAGATTIGNRKGDPSDITMVGPGIQEQHAVITVTQKNEVNLKPTTSDCRVLVNGTLLVGEATLTHNDRLMIGSTQLWVFQHPATKPPTAKGAKKVPEVTYEYAREEIAAKSGLNIGGDTDLGALQDELLQVMPMVEEANSISEELDKRVKFEIMLVAPEVIGAQGKGKTQIHVKMKNLENGTEFVWPQEKFRDRLYQMKEMYEHYEDEDEWERPEDEDPFQESLETEVHMGTVMVVLQPIAHKMDLDEPFTITNIKGAEVGVMNVAIVPCDGHGKEFTDDDNVFVDEPDDLIGQNLHFKFKIKSCRGLPSRYKDMYCSYSMYLDKEVVATKKVSNTTNPEFNHEKQFDFKPVTAQLVDYLRNGSLVVRVMGKQQLRGSAVPPNVGNLSTKDLLRKDQTVFSRSATQFNLDGGVVDPNKQSMVVELLMMKKTQARLQQKIDAVRKLVKEAEMVSCVKVSTSALKDVLNSSSSNQADQIIRKHLQGN